MVDTRSVGHGLLLQNSEKGRIVSCAENCIFRDNKIKNDKTDDISTDCEK